MRTTAGLTLPAVAPTPLRAATSGAGADETHVLVVDLGTGGPKVAVVSATGRIAAHAFEKVPLVLGNDGGAEQEPQEWWDAIVTAGRRAIAESGVDPEKIVGVGCTAQWSGTVAVGGDGMAIGPSIIWMDSRGANAVKRVVRGALNVQGYSASKAARWVRRTGGIPSLSGKDTVGHIHFLREERPDVYSATAVLLEPVDYLNLRLTGLARASHDSITLHWVTDNRYINAVAYDDSLFELAGLERSMLPELVPTGSVLGGVTPDAAAELGLLPGTPVVAGTADLHSAAVGSGAVEDFDGHLYIGTSSWISCHVPFKKTDVLTNIASIPSGLPGRYLVADEHETGGACLTWLRDNLLYPRDALDPHGAPPLDVFSTLNDMAAGVRPGARGVLFTPWLNGERSPVDDHTIPGWLSQHFALHHPVGHGASRLRRHGAQFGLVARRRREVHEEALRFPGFCGWGGQFRPVGPDPRGRDGTHHPPDRRARPGQRPGGGAHHALGPRPHRLADVPSMVEVRAVYTPDKDAGAVYAPLLKEFVNLYEKTKGIHKRLNGHRVSGTEE